MIEINQCRKKRKTYKSKNHSTINKRKRGELVRINKAVTSHAPVENRILATQHYIRILKQSIKEKYKMIIK